MAVSFEFQERFKDLVDELDEPNKTETAKKLGITYNTFSKIYNYGILPQNKILIKIADFFNVPLYYLLGKTDDDRFIKSDKGESFAVRIERLRVERGIKSVYALSQNVHIHQNNIGRWRRFGYIPELEDLEVLASYFGVSLDYLLGRTDDRGINI